MDQQQDTIFFFTQDLYTYPIYTEIYRDLDFWNMGIDKKMQRHGCYNQSILFALMV